MKQNYNNSYRNSSPQNADDVRSHSKRHFVTFLAVVVVGCLFGLHVFQDETPQTDHAHITITHSSNRSPYVNYHHTLLGHVYQPSNFKFKTKASEALVMDAQNGNILYAKNINKPRRIASVSKLMSLYLIHRKADQTHSWNRVIPVSSTLRKMSYDKVLGGFKFKKGHRYTVRELFNAALIDSSNNATIALAQWAGGSNANFIKMMNAQAHVWNINAHFVSPSGLENSDLIKYHLAGPDGKNGANLVSAKAVAIIAQHVLHDMPSITHISDKSSETVDGQKLINVNHNLPKQIFATKGVDGLKTGFTPSAGYTFCSTVKRHGHRLITVLLNDPQVYRDNRNLVNKIYKSFGTDV